MSLVICFLILWAISLIPAQWSDLPQRNIILIGWDGAQREHVKECLGRGELPNLQQLSSEGSIVAIDVLRTTDTKSGWAQILTGYEPEVTGVFSNGRYQPIPAGYTVFERLEDFFGAKNIVTGAVIGKAEHVGADPPERIAVDETSVGYKEEIKGKMQEGTIVVEDGVEYLEIPGKPYFHTKNKMDFFVNGLGANDAVGSKSLEYIDKHKDKPFFFFFHFADIDHKGHTFGENSKQYNDALISSDKWLGKIVEKLRELGLYDKTLIYVTADHGFDEGMNGHADAPYVFLATNDKGIVRRGTRADITPTILARFGLDLSELTPPLDGHPLTEDYAPPIW